MFPIQLWMSLKTMRMIHPPLWLETKQPSRSTGYIKGSIILAGDKYEIDDEHNAPSVAARPLGPLR